MTARSSTTFANTIDEYRLVLSLEKGGPSPKDEGMCQGNRAISRFCRFSVEPGAHSGVLMIDVRLALTGLPPKPSRRLRLALLRSRRSNFRPLSRCVP